VTGVWVVGGLVGKKGRGGSEANSRGCSSTVLGKKVSEKQQGGFTPSREGITAGEREGRKGEVNGKRKFSLETD